VITNDSSIRLTSNNPTSKARGARIALWVLQIALAAMFLFSGGSKLIGAPAMVALFDAIGWGQWFRYLTGVIEMSAAVALLIPSLSVFGALLLIPTMIGASATNLLLGQTVIPPLVLLALPRQLHGHGAMQYRRLVRSR
jgi:putative oxidoreductase